MWPTVAMSDKSFCMSDTHPGPNTPTCLDDWQTPRSYTLNTKHSTNNRTAEWLLNNHGLAAARLRSAGLRYCPREAGLAFAVSLAFASSLSRAGGPGVTLPG